MADQLHAPSPFRGSGAAAPYLIADVVEGGGDKMMESDFVSEATNVGGASKVVRDVSGPALAAHWRIALKQGWGSPVALQGSELRQAVG